MTTTTVETDKVSTPESSNIASFAYAPTRSALIVEFKDKSGRVTAIWEYEKVPPHIFDEMKNVVSVGSFLRCRVIGYYEGRKFEA